MTSLPPFRVDDAVAHARWRQLRSTDGLLLRAGAFRFRVRSQIRQVADAISVLYTPSDVLVGGDFADFQVSINSHWHGLKRVCVLDVDGYSPFTPLAYGEAYALLEWGMNWCITSMHHSRLTVHAAVLAKDDRAIVLPAPPGSGKSTLCAALMLRGWRLLSDEMALLDTHSGQLWPAPRPVSLKNRSIEIIARRAPDLVWGPVAFDTIKGTVCHLKPTQESLLSRMQPATPAWVIYPRYRSGAGLVVQPVDAPQSLLKLADNSFNRHVLGREGFQGLVRLINAVQSFNLEYDDLDAALDWCDRLPRGGGDRI